MNNTKKISSVNELSSELQQRITSTQHLIDIYRGILGDEHREDVATVEQWVEECRNALASPSPVSVALLGGTGAGKSTLVNSLLGARVLPTNPISVCTSAITRVRYLAGSEYKASIEIVPRATWEKQVLLASEDIKAAKEGDDSDSAFVNTSVIPDDESARLIAIYGAEAFEMFSRDGDLSHLIEPSEIQEAFEKETIQLIFENTEDLRKGISRYLTSSEAFWPIVRSCVIEGPFESFDHGGELVDLPGLNDPNEAREEMTKTFLETAKFVWVVFNMKRSLGKEITQVLESRDLLNRLMAGGRISTLSFVGTHSDDVSTINPEDFGLEEDASNSEIALKRNELAEIELRSNLRNVARSVITSGESTSESTSLIDAFVESPAFMVSASNYLQIMGATKSRVLPIFEDKYETNVPSLGNHLKTLCIEAGPKANAYTLVSSLEEVVAELATLAREAQTEVALRNSQGAAAKVKLAETAKKSEEELKIDAEKIVSKLRRSLQGAVDRFDKGTALDEEVLIKAIQRITAGWAATHWATLRATTSRGGRFHSASKGEIDLIKELSAPVIQHSMIPWSNFFGKDLPNLTNEASSALQDVLTKYSNSLLQFGADDPEVKGVVTKLMSDLMADVIESVEVSLEVVKKAVESDLNQRRQELHRITEDAIASSMASVFASAAAERGTGMKVRMNATLESGSKKAVRLACGRVQKELGLTAKLAMGGVIEQVEPAAAKIAEKSIRITATLSDLAPTKKFATQQEIATLLSAVDAARRVVSPPIRFQDGVLSNKSTQEESADVPLANGTVNFDKKFVFVDASNVARSPGAAPDVQKLAKCREELFLKFPEASIVLVADASLPRLVEQDSDESDKVLLKKMISDEQLTIVPPGSPGKADKFILQLATSRTGLVVSNDSYREFHDEYQWLFDEGRLWGHTFVPGVGWEFSIRFPVRARPLPPPPVMKF